MQLKQQLIKMKELGFKEVKPLLFLIENEKGSLFFDFRKGKRQSYSYKANKEEFEEYRIFKEFLEKSKHICLDKFN